MIRILLVTLLAFTNLLYSADRKGLHQVEKEKHPSKKEIVDISKIKKAAPLAAPVYTLNKGVMGYHPYWAGKDDYLNYDYRALSVLAYFDYALDTSDGTYTTIHGWESSEVINHAHMQGVKVILTVTNFGYDNNDAFLNDTNKQNNFIEIITDLIEKRGGDGVNIDFESVRSSQKQNLTNFMEKLSTYMKARIPEAEISMAMPSVDWNNAWDYKALGEICDYLMPMCYNYYYSGSQNAGPVSPLEGGSYNIKRTIQSYINTGVPAEKIWMGLPWYGYDWAVENNSRKSATTAKGKAIFYYSAEDNLSQYGKNFDEDAKSVWVSYRDGEQWHQAWWDDSLCQSYKFDYINEMELGGLGIWAINYGVNRQELWDGIIMTMGDPNSVADNHIKIENVKIYPNPCKDYIIVQSENPADNINAITISDLSGNIIRHSPTRINGFTIKVNTEKLTAGAYFITLKNPDGKIIKAKIIKEGI